MESVRAGLQIRLGSPCGGPCDLYGHRMVIYKIEASPEPFIGQWIVTAVLGNYHEWQVGRYSEKWKAQERVLCMEAIRKAEAATT